MTEFFLWYGIIWLIGLVGLPYSFAFFSRLPDRGYAFSRPLGVWTLTIVAWWLGNIKLLPFTGNSCWLVLGGLALGGLGVTIYNRREMWQWFSRWPNLRLILIGEILFFLAYAFIVNYRSYLPALNQSEKFFDYGFINAIFAAPNLPPPDPWYGGAPMNYYYGGQLYMAVLSKLSGTEPSTGYNIGMGLVFGLAILGCYGLGSNLIGLWRGKNRPSLLGGLVGASFIMLLGNVDAIRQFSLHAPQQLAEGKFPPYFDWPATARMVYDPMPDGRLLDILTEYPIYSWLNGDLHAHLLGIPYVTLALALILNTFVASKGWALVNLSPTSPPKYLLAGLIMGAPYLINAGDFPTYLGILIVGLALTEARMADPWRWRLVRWLMQIVLLGVALVFVYLPYLTNFNGMIKGKPFPEVADVPLIGWFSRYLGWVSWRGTYLAEYSVMYGLFFFSIIIFMALKIAQLWRNAQEDRPNNRLNLASRLIVKGSGLILLLLAIDGLVQIFLDASARTLSLNSALVTAMTLPIAFVTLKPGAWENVRTSATRENLLVGMLLGLVLLGFGPLLKLELLGPMAALLFFAMRLGFDSWRRSTQDKTALFDTLFCVFIAFAALITLFIENLYVRDIYTNRFNTMFKFWYQLWMLYGLSAIYATWRVMNWRQLILPVMSGIDQTRKAFAPQPRFATSEATNLFTPQYEMALLPATPGGSGSGGYWSGSNSLPVSEARQRRPGGWQWLWLIGLVFLAITALACPVLGYWQVTNHYQNRVGLDGEAWYSEEYPTEYPAMKWLREYARNDPSKRGVVLETNGMNYSWYDRISTYTGLPTIVGWPFHELQWRAAMEDTIIWEAWLDMNRIYETTDTNKALELLHKHNVRYVFVGQIENGTRTGRDNKNDYRQYSPEALAKFATFMKTIYSDPANNIYIYAFY